MAAQQYCNFAAKGKKLHVPFQECAKFLAYNHHRTMWKGIL